MNKTELEQLAKDYSLVKEDFFVQEMGGRKIITVAKSGIQKIQRSLDILIEYEVVCATAEHACIKAVGYRPMKDDSIKFESIASANAQNCRNKYFAEMAEKRARGRVVLELAGISALAEGEDLLEEK